MAKIFAAHFIRRPATTFYRAVSELKAKSRWCLTGTPIQNRLEDVGALFAFIRIRPFHSLAMFRRFVVIPYNEADARRAEAIRNLTLLLDSMCLRRCRDLLYLPELRTQDRLLYFSDKERSQYNTTMGMMNRSLRQSSPKHHSKNIFGMFQIQLQLRLLCNHGTYQQIFSWNRRNRQDEREDALCSVGESGQVRCSACCQPMPLLGSINASETVKEGCRHIFCSECSGENEDASVETHECPLCLMIGGPLPKLDDNRNSYLRQDGFSTKIIAVMEDIKQDLWATKRLFLSCKFTLSDIANYFTLEA